MFSPNEREPGYPKRDNGYSRSPYDDRDWYRRSEFSSRDLRERDYAEEYRYRQKRDWNERLETNPSPKRRKMGRDDMDSPLPYHKPKEYKRSYPRYYRSSRSPRSPSPMSSGKERYPLAYYEREPYKPSYRDRKADYGSRSNFYREPLYSRGDRTSWEVGRSGSKYDYKQYDNGFQRREYEDYRRGYDREGYEREYEKEAYDPYEHGRSYERDYDRREYSREKYRALEDYPRESEREYSRDYYKKEEYYYDREKERERERTRANVEYYSPTRASDSESDDERNRSRDSGRGSSNSETTTPVLDPEESEYLSSPEKPQPKKRLGWGQGLVAFEKRGTDSPSPSPKLENGSNELQMNGQPFFDSPEIKKEALGNASREISPSEVESDSPPQDPRLSLQQEFRKAKEETKEEKMEVEEEGPLYEFPRFPSKEEVLGSIEKLDSEITKTEMLISNLKRPKKLEHKHHRGIQTTIEEIYEDNSERVSSIEEELSAFIPNYLKDRKGPLYKRPADLPSFAETIRQHESVRSRLSKVVWQKRKAAKEWEEQLVEKYLSLRERWKKKVHKLEAKRKKKEKALEIPPNTLNPIPEVESHHRRPSLRSRALGPTGSSRGSARFSLGDAARSEAEFDMIMSHLKEEDDRDMESKYIKTIAEIPPMLFKSHRPPDYVDMNGLVVDPMAADRERKMLNPWIDTEKALFLKKFLQYPKQFSKISSYFENKTTEEVVWYYYANKRTLNLKKLLIEQQSKRRGYTRKVYVPPPPPPTSNSSLPREVANLGVSPYWSLGSMRSSRSYRVNYSESVTEEKGSRTSPTIATDTDTKWTDLERDMFIDALDKYGKEFKAISMHIGSKNQFQCKNFYHNSKKKFGLDKIVEAANKRKKAKEGEKKPASSDSRRVANSWTDEDRAEFIQFFKMYGKNWKKMAENMTGKTMNQIKYYYQISRQKLNLDKLLEEETEEKEDGRKKRKQTGERKRKTKKAKMDSDSSPAPSPVMAPSPAIVPSPAIAPSPAIEAKDPNSSLDAASTLLAFASTILAASQPPQHLSASREQPSRKEQPTETNIPSSATAVHLSDSSSASIDIGETKPATEESDPPPPPRIELTTEETMDFETEEPSFSSAQPMGSSSTSFVNEESTTATNPPLFLSSPSQSSSLHETTTKNLSPPQQSLNPQEGLEPLQSNPSPSSPEPKETLEPSVDSMDIEPPTETVESPIDPSRDTETIVQVTTSTVGSEQLESSTTSTQSEVDEEIQITEVETTESEATQLQPSAMETTDGNSNDVDVTVTSPTAEATKEATSVTEESAPESSTLAPEITPEAPVAQSSESLSPALSKETSVAYPAPEEAPITSPVLSTAPIPSETSSEVLDAPSSPQKSELVGSEAPDSPVSQEDPPESLEQSTVADPLPPQQTPEEVISSEPTEPAEPAEATETTETTELTEPTETAEPEPSLSTSTVPVGESLEETAAPVDSMEISAPPEEQLGSLSTVPSFDPDERTLVIDEDPLPEDTASPAAPVDDAPSGDPNSMVVEQAADTGRTVIHEGNSSTENFFNTGNSLATNEEQPTDAKD